MSHSSEYIYKDIKDNERPEVLAHMLDCYCYFLQPNGYYKSNNQSDKTEYTIQSLKSRGYKKYFEL